MMRNSKNKKYAVYPWYSKDILAIFYEPYSYVMQVRYKNNKSERWFNVNERMFEKLKNRLDIEDILGKCKKNKKYFRIHSHYPEIESSINKLKAKITEYSKPKIYKTCKNKKRKS